MNVLKYVLAAGLAAYANAGTYQYTVYFWKIPCVRITMNGSAAGTGELEFRATTTKAFSYIFPVDNRYSTSIDPETFQMLRYEKEIEQPNLNQTLKIVWNSSDGTYSSDDVQYSRPEGTHNIFSLLLRARTMEWETLDTEWWPLDHEGRLMQSRFMWIDSTEIDLQGETSVADHYRLDLVPGIGSNVSLVEMTDVFTWGIALEDCVRQIWVEKGGEKRILRAEVKVKGITLFAELTDD